MNITIGLTDKQYSELLEIAKITKIKPQKIIEVFLEENFFNQNNYNKEKMVKIETNTENFLQILKERFKELEITQDDLSKVFKTSIPTVSKALSGKQVNFVYRKFKKAYEDNNIENFLKHTYLLILAKNFPHNIEDEELIELSKRNSIFQYYLGFLNKKLDGRFNEEYFTNNVNLEELEKELEEVDLQNLSADEIFGKFTYLYEYL